jgi:hypothetical protein
MLTEFYALSAIAGFIFLGANFVSEMKPKKVKYNPTPSPKSEPEPEPEQQTATAKDYSTLHAIADAHADYTAEVGWVYASGKNRHSIKNLPIGTKVELRIDSSCGLINLFVNGHYIGLTSYFEDKTRLFDVIGKNDTLEVYKCSTTYHQSSSMELFSVIAFYKMDGIAPTKVEIS